MSIRTLLDSLTLFIALFLFSEVSQAQTGLDLRYQQGVDVVQAQRDGLDDILSILERMDRLAKLASEPNTSNALRTELNTRFQLLKYDIQNVADTSTHGWRHLHATLWISVQDSPGSSQGVTVHGEDVGIYALALDNQQLSYQHEAHSAVISVEHAKWRVLSTLQTNCLDQRGLGLNPGCGAMRGVCEGGLNSTGYHGRLDAYGTLVAGQANQLFMNVTLVPHDYLGWFIMGRGVTAVPIANVGLCSSPSAMQALRLSSSVFTEQYLHTPFSLAEADPQAVSQILPGSTWYFQFLYMDGQISRMNSTNALRVTFEP